MANQIKTEMLRWREEKQNVSETDRGEDLQTFFSNLPVALRE